MTQHSAPSHNLANVTIRHKTQYRTFWPENTWSPRATLRTIPYKVKTMGAHVTTDINITIFGNFCPQIPSFVPNMVAYDLLERYYRTLISTMFILFIHAVFYVGCRTSSVIFVTGSWKGRRKPVHTVGVKVSVLQTADQRQASTSSPKQGWAGIWTLTYGTGRRVSYHCPTVGPNQDL